MLSELLKTKPKHSHPEPERVIQNSISWHTELNISEDVRNFIPAYSSKDLNKKIFWNVG